MVKRTLSLRLGVEVLEDRTVPAAQSLGPTDLVVDMDGPNPTVQVADALYFLASEGPQTAPTLWRTDGTAQHTTRLSDDPVFSGLGGLYVREVAAVGGTVYVAAAPASSYVAEAGFSMPPPLDCQLWELDPDLAGGVRQLTSGAAGVGTLKAAGDQLFYTTPMPDIGQTPPDLALWVIQDGFAPIRLMTFSDPWWTMWFDMPKATVAGRHLYFDAGYDRGLWVSDGTTSGTHAVTGAFTVRDRIPLGDKLVFTAIGADYDDELWVADGSTASRLMAFAGDPWAPQVGWDPPSDWNGENGPHIPSGQIATGLTSDGKVAMFSLSEPYSHGTSIWTTDGTSDGSTQIIPRLAVPGAVPGTSLYRPTGGLTPAGRTLFYTTEDVTGIALWRYDGAPSLVKVITPPYVGGGFYGVSVIDGVYYFSANDGAHCRQIWSSDGTTEGTIRLTDIPGGVANPWWLRVFEVNGRLLSLFRIEARDSDGSASRYKLWSLSRPTPVQTVTTLSVPTNRIVAGETVILTAIVAPKSGGETPTGYVTFQDGNKVIGTVIVDATGTARLSRATLGSGRRVITAIFTATEGFQNSTATKELTVVPTTTMKLVADSFSSVFGQSVIVTATVRPTDASAAKPTGVVTLMDGDVILGTEPLINGVATFRLSRPALGWHMLTANYAGDSQFTGTTSAAIGLSVHPAPIIVSVSPPAFRRAGTSRR